MKAQPTDVEGAAGHTEVKAELQALGCGPVDNPPPHDLGTDMWVQVLDERLFNRGIVVGAQVKSGPSWFKEPVHEDDGTVSGWVHREDVAHFDDWVRHGLPHFLILRDRVARKSYWVHVTQESVTVTGKQCKITVPAANVLGEETFEQFFQAAATQKAAKSYEGSAWKAGAAAAPPARRLRWALLVPRLVAPHPNRTMTDLQPIEAVALAAANRTDDWDVSAKHHGVKSRVEAWESSDWMWRFAAALARWVHEGESAALCDELDTPEEEAAHLALLVAKSCALAERGDHPEAVHEITQHEFKKLSPVDNAWLLVHQARRLAETGHVQEARDLAVAAQRQLVGDDDDPTATDLAAAAALLLLNSAVGWSSTGLEETMPHLDTAASWWRGRDLSHALAAQFKRQFDGWSHKSGVTFARVDSVDVGLRAVCVAWDLNGSSGDWGAAAARLHRYRLVEAHDRSDVPGLTQAIRALAICGDHEGIKLAGRRLRRIGPVVALRDATTSLSMDALTATSLRACLELWKACGDLLDEDLADDVAELCLDSLEADDSLFRRLLPRWHPLPIATEALASALHSCSPSMHQRVLALALRIVTSGQAEDGMWEAELRSLIQAARFETLDEVALDEWMTVVSAAEARWVPRALSRLAEAGRSEARDLIVERAAAGDLQSVYELDSAEVLGAEGARQVLDTVNAVVRTDLNNAQRGMWSVGIHNYGAILGWAAVAYPDLADWNLIVDLATSAVASGEEKSALLSTLARNPDAIPAGTRGKLLARRAELSLSAPDDFMLGDGSPAGSAEELWIALADPEEIKQLAGSAVARLLPSADPRERAEVAQIIFATESHELLPLVGSLLNDPAVEVRIAAARLTGILAGKGSDLINDLAEQILTDAGAVIPFHFAGTALASLDGPPSAPLRAIAEQLSTHPGARVRRLALQILASDEAGSEDH